jgi:hypothetical protein
MARIPPEQAGRGHGHDPGLRAEVGEFSDHDCLLNTNDPVWHLRQAGHDVHLKINDPVYSSNSYQTLRKAAPARHAGEITSKSA